MDRNFEIDGQDYPLNEEEILRVGRGIRPSGMDKDVFKQIKKIVKKEEKEYLRGKLFHLSKISNQAWADLVKPNEHGYRPKQKGHTFVKKTSKTKKKH